MSDNLKEDLDALDPEAEVQQAYDTALKMPWTIARHSAAMSLGCKVIAAVGPDVKELMTRGTYSNSLRDVIIALWLCSLSETEVIGLNCTLTKADEGKAIRTAYAWAEKMGLTYGSKLFLEGLALLDSIISSVWKSFYDTTGNGEPQELKKNSFRPGKSESDITLLKPADTQPGM